MQQHFSITASIFLLETHRPSQLAWDSPDAFYPGEKVKPEGWWELQLKLRKLDR